MSSAGWARDGVVVEESKDSGPFPIVKVLSDGKKVDVTIISMGGLTGSPLKDSKVIILPLDGDMGRAYGLIAGSPTSDRVDAQKPGETTLKNHKTGNHLKHQDNGDTVVVTSGIVHVNPPA